MTSSQLDTANTLRLAANELYREGKTTEAIEKYREALEHLDFIGTSQVQQNAHVDTSPFLSTFHPSLSTT